MTGYIGYRRVPTIDAGSNVWRLREQAAFKKDRIWPKVIPEPYWNNVSLLLHCEGSNNSTTFTDVSKTPKTVTVYSAVKISTAQYKIGTSSAFTDTGGALGLAANTAFAFGTGDFTIEFWIRFTSITGYQTAFAIDYVSAGGLTMQTGSGTGRFIVYVSGSPVISETGTASTGVWIHYALVRSGTSLKLYRDGTESGSATDSTNLVSTVEVTLFSGSGNYFLGYMDEIRITKGVARYTGNFTPATTAFPDNE